MRHFFISFIANGRPGSMTFSLDGFPPQDWIQKQIAASTSEGGVQIKPSDIALLNIFEFQSEEDFEMFNSTDYKTS